MSNIIGVQAWPIETDDQVETLARECGWNNRRYMTPADYSGWCEQMRKFARLSALHPAPEAASAGGAGETMGETISAYEFMAQEFDRLAILRKMWSANEVAATIRKMAIPSQSEDRPPAAPSDTAPSPKSVSDGVREAARRAVDAFRTYAIALRGPFATRYDTANDLDTQAKLLEAALSQEHAPGRKEGR